MFAILHDHGAYIGFKKIQEEGEERTFQLNYILVEQVPEELLNIPQNHMAIVSEVGGEVVVNYEPIPTPEPEQDEITRLKLAMAEMAEVYEQEMTDLQLALAEIAELVAGGDK